ncbi:maleylpyruvate isomerase N-terminal domain-containing protein [Kitasatospora sp. NPDC097605]|uniref:maleylpyruvate isomerase N-terminal domain-containing protein n=1 Tax=Kitasatospora sp. NPDC097605 TaxID=3157226 RepID=UPI003328119B
MITTDPEPTTGPATTDGPAPADPTAAGPTPDDLAAVLRLAVNTLRAAPADADWSRSAGALDWDCWNTVEHLADDLLAYAAQLGPERPPRDRYVPFVSRRPFPGGPNSFVFARREDGPQGLLEVLEASGGLMVAIARTRTPEVRAFHPWGLADPAGFVAMSLVETLVHLHDVAEGLGLPWEPPAEACRRTLARLFPDVTPDPADDPWPTLLWATGRAALPGRPPRTDWRWYADVREPTA